MVKHKKRFKRLATWWECLFCGMLIIACPAQATAGQSKKPEGKVIFEDKKAGVKIIKTTAGVILKIITDKQGRVSVEELEHDPA
jgi:hypothetical protein